MRCREQLLRTRLAAGRFGPCAPRHGEIAELATRSCAHHAVARHEVTVPGHACFSRCRHVTPPAHAQGTDAAAPSAGATAVPRRGDAQGFGTVRGLCGGGRTWPAPGPAP